MKRAEPRLPADAEPAESELFHRLSEAGRPACPDPAELQAMLADVLPDDRARALRDHVAGCAACRLLADAMEAWEGPEVSAHETERLWRRVRAEAAAPSRQPMRQPTRRWAFSAAAAALFVLAVPAYILIRGGDPQRPSPPPGNGGAQSSVLPLDKLPVLTPPGAALVWRDGGDAFQRDLGDALGAYERGALEEAARRLNAMAAQYPAAPAPPLYLGLTRLLQGRADEAAEALASARARGGPFWTPHATWYLAVARERVGDRAGAAALLAELCGPSGDYAARACAARTALEKPGR